MTNDKTKELPTGFIITVYRAGRSLVRLVKAAVVQWRASPNEIRSGSLPSRRISDGRKLRFHCCKTMRVLGNPESTRADPMARAPAGAIRRSA